MTVALAVVGFILAGMWLLVSGRTARQRRAPGRAAAPLVHASAPATGGRRLSHRYSGSRGAM